MTSFPMKIVVATNGSEEAQPATRAAIEIANRTDSELHVVHAWSPGEFPPSPPYPGVAWEGFFPTEVMEELERRAREVLEE